MRYPREFFIPKDAVKIEPSNGADAECYTYELAGKFYAVGFAGKAGKPAFHYWYKSEADRQNKIDAFFAGRAAHKQAVADRRADQRARGRGLEVGDVLRSSWGYEQTNIDYYEVVALIGKSMVEIRELMQVIHETGSMQGKCAPLKGQYKGTPTRHVARDGGVKIEHTTWAYKMTPRMIGGVPVYDPDNWTAYH